MIFGCPNCETDCPIPDERIKNRILKVRCKNCQHVFYVKDPALEEPAADSLQAPPVPDSDDVWFYAANQQTMGPVSVASMRHLMETSVINSNTLVWREGLGEWKPLSEVTELTTIMKTIASPSTDAPIAPGLDEVETEKPRTTSGIFEVLESQDALEEEEELSVDLEQDDEIIKSLAEEEEKLQESRKKRKKEREAKEKSKKEKPPVIPEEKPDKEAIEKAKEEKEEAAKIAAEKKALEEEKKRIEAEKRALEEEKQKVQRMTQELQAVKPEAEKAPAKAPEVEKKPIEKRLTAMEMAAISIEEEKKEKKSPVMMIGIIAAVVIVAGIGVALALGGSDKKQEKVPEYQPEPMAEIEVKDQNANLFMDMALKDDKKEKEEAKKDDPNIDDQMAKLDDELAQKAKDEASNNTAKKAKPAKKSTKSNGTKVAKNTPAKTKKPAKKEKKDDALSAMSAISMPALPTEQQFDDPSLPSGLSQDQIRVVINRNRARLQYCYDMQLRRNPNLSGKLEVNFAINKKGRVDSVKVVSRRFKGSYMETCVKKAIKSWKFPRFRGDPITVEYPFVFSSF